MSGPIVRKYGFPNFEQIFGKRDLQHGIDEPPPAPAPTGEPSGVQPAPKPSPAEPIRPADGK